MRKSFTAMFLALAPVAALTTLAPMAPAHAQQATVSISLFYDQLSAHGKWVEHPRWGWVWYPNDVDQNWRPYTRGRWVWTQEYGWFWESTEPFGWATYHYGRWGYDDQYGWVWVPGDRWAASWVAFRYSDQYVGWAPLPPDTLQVSGSVSIDDAVFTAAYYQPRWVFVESRAFVDPRLETHIVPAQRNVTIIRETRNVTNITVQNNVFVNRSFEPQRIRAVVGHDIPTVRVNRVNDVSRLDIRSRNQTNINQVNVFNPQVRIDRNTQPPERARARDTDRPRVAVRPDLVRPEDRRDRTAPGTTPGQTDRERGQQPNQPRTTTPGSPPSTTQPNQPRTGEQERRDRTTPSAPPGRPGTDTERNRTSPGQQQQQRRDERGTERQNQTPPNTTPPGAPPSRQGTTPSQPQRQQPQQQDDRRGDRTAPAQPPRTAPGAPPSRGQPEEKRGATPATPAQPPKVAPSAPPSHPSAQPPSAQQPQRGQPQQPGQKKDEKKEQ